MGLFLLYFHVFEHGRLDIDTEIPALPGAERDPAEVHFPAV